MGTAFELLELAPLGVVAPPWLLLGVVLLLLGVELDVLLYEPLPVVELY